MITGFFPVQCSDLAMKCHPYIWTKMWWDQHDHLGSPRVEVFSRVSPRLTTCGFHANAERSTLEWMCFPSCLLQGFSASCTFSLQFWIYSCPTNAIFCYLPETLSIATKEFKLTKGGQLKEESLSVAWKSLDVGNCLHCLCSRRPLLQILEKLQAWILCHFQLKFSLTHSLNSPWC